MRIAFLHGSNDLYGASRVLLSDVRILSEAGHAVDVILPDEGPLTRPLTDAGARVVVTPVRVLRKVDGMRALRPPVQLPAPANEADVVVTWTLALSGYLPLIRARRKLAIASVHEILEGRSGTYLARGTARFAHRIMTNSETTTGWLVHCGVASRACTLSYPEAPQFRPLERPAFDGTLRAVLAGRVNGHKGQLEAVEAVRIARSSGVSVDLDLVGGAYPGQEPHLEALLRAIDGMEGVRYLGEVDDVVPVMQRAHVVLVPTTQPEPFGVVALEAWACGRRVIASDTGGLREATRMVEGISVPPRDSAALAAALGRVATEPALRESPREDAEVSRLCTAEHRRRAWTNLLRR